MREGVISISMDNTKMGPIPSFSIAPIVSCNPDAPCRGSRCYAVRLCRFRSNIRKAWYGNFSIVESDPMCENFQRQMLGWLDFYQPTAFRIHVAGDFYRYEYLESWMSIARRNPKVRFFSFTKQFGILEDYLFGDHGTVRNGIPKNMAIILSAWKDFVPPDRLQRMFPVAWIRFEKDEPISKFSTKFNNGNVILCEGHCSTCGRCFTKRRKDGDVVFDVH